LRDLYERWGLLSQAESDAIRSRDWAHLAKCQNQKQALADEIDGLREAAGDKDHRATLKPLLEKLIALESENVRMLASHREQLAEEQNALTQAGRTLQQVHRAYVRDQTLIWNSYS
jgi:hypothetical protein